MIRAVYPGSFDPITNGHIYIAERASSLFDELYVAVLHNPQKRATFSVDERQAMAREATSHLPNVRIKSFEGLLVDFMRKEQSRIIIRGLRALSDFEYEFQMGGMNARIDPSVETLFLMASERCQFISSRFVKEIGWLGGDISSFVSPRVRQKLTERWAEMRVSDPVD